MSLLEGTTLAVMAVTLLLIAVRCFGVKEGKVTRGYQIGKAQTIGDRQAQEDFEGISRSPHGLLAVLADGMGRNFGGKIAGKIAVETICEIFNAAGNLENPLYFLKRAFHAANHEILKELEEDRGGASVGAVILQEERLYYGLAGNVKMAVFRNGRLVPISSGHTLSALAEEEFHRGNLSREEISGVLESKRVYNYLGRDGFQEIEVSDLSIALHPADIVVLMSDGVYEGVSWRELEDCLARHQTCRAKATEIMELIHSSSKKDKDNASVILIQQP